VVSNNRCNHRDRDKKQWPKDQIPNAQNNKDKIKRGNVKQIYAVGVKSYLLGSEVNMFLRGVMESIDGESKSKAKKPADPEESIVVKLSGVAVTQDEQEHKWRPDKCRNACRDAIPQRIAENSAKEARDIFGHAQVAFGQPKNQNAESAKTRKQAAEPEDSALTQS
jgi:hypothetical protein